MLRRFAAFFGFALLACPLAFGLSACAPKVSLFGDGSAPLEESTLRGAGKDKVLLVQGRGVIASDPGDGLLRRRPSLVQEVVSRLDKAAEDERVKAVVLMIDSPGGSSADSDVLFHEIERYRNKSGAKTVALLMRVAASGGYYAALACDRIMAHPMTITGSVGTIFMRPKVQGLMDKLGLAVETTKSGRLKDMASPFRPTEPEEAEIIQAMVTEMNGRFLELARERRGLSPEGLEDVATARIYTAGQAQAVGLVDAVGYLDDAFAEARRLAALPDDARLVVYRRAEYPNDTPYNVASTTDAPVLDMKLVDLGLADFLASPRTGFYWLWAPEMDR